MIQVTTTNGTTVATPQSISQNLIQYLLKQDPTYNTSNITYFDFTSLFFQSAFEYNPTLSSNNPNLSGFRNFGAKLLSWHGLSDNLIASNSTLDYRQRVDALMGGTHTVDSFYRVFFAPGVNHCGAGYGPVPINAFDQLVAWVENGTVPETLPAQFVDVEGEVVDHNICKYPLVSKYIGGDPKAANSYVCGDFASVVVSNATITGTATQAIGSATNSQSMTSPTSSTKMSVGSESKPFAWNQFVLMEVIAGFFTMGFVVVM